MISMKESNNVKDKHDHSNHHDTMYTEEGQNMADHISPNIVPSTSDKISDSVKSSQQQTIHLTLIVCGERSDQALTMLKSVTMTTKQNLHFHIFAEDELHDGMKERFALWPQVKSGQVQFRFLPVKYPEFVDTEKWKKLYRKCTTLRLFIPNMLPDVDAAIYVDTDMIFMHDVKSLWKYFKSFNSSHLASAVFEHYDKSISWYNTKAEIPFIQPFGINAGIILMNLTRMRAIKDWDRQMVDTREERWTKIKWADQDILNIFFAFRPHLFTPIPCRWNYRTEFCRDKPNICPDVQKHGIYLLHGSRGVFDKDDAAKWALPEFRKVFEAFNKYDVIEGKGMGTIIEDIQRNWKHGRTSHCQNHLDLFLKNLKKFV